MNRDEVLDVLRDHAPDLRRRGVSRLFLFGSVSRDEATASSDVDMFFDFDNPRFDLIDLLSLRDRLSEILHAPADVMSRGSLHPGMRAAIESAAVRVF